MCNSAGAFNSAISLCRIQFQEGISNNDILALKLLCWKPNCRTADEEQAQASDHKVSSAVGKELILVWKRDTLEYSNIQNSSSLRAYTVENG
jgi:hypothetical protein